MIRTNNFITEDYSHSGHRLTGSGSLASLNFIAANRNADDSRRLRRKNSEDRDESVRGFGMH